MTSSNHAKAKATARVPTWFNVVSAMLVPCCSVLLAFRPNLGVHVFVFVLCYCVAGWIYLSRRSRQLERLLREPFEE